MFQLSLPGRKTKKARAVWKNTVLAESDEYLLSEGNVNFPPQTVRWEYLRPASRHHNCPWKGEIYYFDIVVDGMVNKNAAWTCPHPLPPARQFKDCVAFSASLLGGTVEIDR